MKVILQKIWILCVLVSLPPLIAKDKALEAKVKQELKAYKHEAKELGSEQNSQIVSMLKSLLNGGDSSMSSEDLLPDEDKGRAFDSSRAAEQVDSHQISPIEAEIDSILKTAPSRERFEGTEEFFSGAVMAIATPELYLGIASDQSHLVEQQDRFESCIEGGSFEVVVGQSRDIKIIPEIKESVSRCIGHREATSFYWKKDAEKAAKDKRKLLGKDPSLASFQSQVINGDSGSGVFKDYLLSSTWVHKDGVACDACIRTEKVTFPSREEDIWNSADKTTLDYLEKTPSCRLVCQKTTSKPEARSINGRSVFRESWTRNLFFSCGGDQDPKCKRIRDEGGAIVKKECVRETDFGECDLFQKTYKLRGASAYDKREISFQEEEIWGVEEFERKGESNNEFGEAISKLSVFSALPGNISQNGPNIAEAAAFGGSCAKCRKSFATDALYDCCSSPSGLALNMGLAGCSAEEKDLFKDRKAGKCHYMGIISKKAGLEKEKVYCCFPTQLARVIQEEGRKQLGIDWGDVDTPRCQGLTLAQIASLNFDLMDFSDVIAEFSSKVDERALKNHIKQKVSALSEEHAKQTIGLHVQEEERKTGKELL